MAGEFNLANLDAAYQQYVAGALAITETFGADLQARLRSDAPWSDRNGPSKTGLNARQSLEVEVGMMDGEGETIQLVARSTRQTLTAWRGWDGAPVGAFLELGTRKMRRRAVIQPDLEATAPDLQRQLQTALGAP